MSEATMKDAREWLEECVRVATRNGVPEEADLEAAALAFIDGEPGRIAAAKEEMREACALGLEKFKTGNDLMTHAEQVEMQACANMVRATPLDSEPLKARIAELEREREGMLMGGVTVEARQQLERAEKAEARVAELEAANAALLEVNKAVGVDAHERAEKAERERDELRALNAELVELVEPILRAWDDDIEPRMDGVWVSDARAVLAKAEKARGG